MSRRNVVGATVVTAALGVGAAVPATGAAQVPHKLRGEYLKTYKQVKKLGGRPGRNIVRHGVSAKGRHRPARIAEVRRSLQVLRNMRASLGGGVVRGGGSTGTAAPAAAHGGGGGGGLPACTWQPESGGDYGAQGPGGAGGKYQIIPSTWKAYGGSGANAAQASPAEQDAVAARIYAGQGASAWVNC